MKIINLKQNTPEWSRFRSLHIGASDAGTIMNLNPYDSRLRLWEEKTLGWEKKQNSNMKRGQELEILAREFYILRTGMDVNPIVAEDEVFPFLSVSFDGMTDDCSHAVEIKCGKSSFQMAKKGFIPAYYIAQLQHQMLIGNLQEIDYWCFDGNEGILIKVKRDNDFIREMIDQELEFWRLVENFIEPVN